jgi:hypothetical protein
MSTLRCSGCTCSFSGDHVDFAGVDGSTIDMIMGSGRPSRLAAMVKWEYATVPLLVHVTKQILDNWGQDGWELVQVVPGPNPENVVAYLKREKPE